MEYYIDDFRYIMTFQSCLYMWAAVFHCRHGDRSAKDFTEYYVHHVCTLVLTGFAAIVDAPGGVMASYVHDISDVFVDVTKLLHRTTLAPPNSSAKVSNALDGGLTVSTALMLGAWTYYRIYVLGLYVLCPVFGNVFTMWMELQSLRETILFCCTRILISVIYGMNIYWWYCIWSLIYRDRMDPSARRRIKEEESSRL
jgi:hypothetical protein